MKKLVLLCLMVVFAFAMKPQNTVLPAPEQPTVLEPGIDLIPEANPLFQQMFQARRNSDWSTYNKLFELYRSQLTFPDNDLPAVEESKPEKNPQLRWNGDRIIFAGNVAYNQWAMGGNIDDEAISLDHYKGDTLRAAVVTLDSTLWAFQSNDNGLTWSACGGWAVSNNAVYEPEIINDPSGRFYHVFCRPTSGNGDILVITDSIAGGWYARWIESTGDTAANYSICSDRAQYGSDYFLFCFYHRRQGGPSNDEILLSRSFDFAVTWEAPTPIQGSGSGFPDLAFGDNNYLYETYYARLSTGEKLINTRRSSDEGDTWFSSVNVHIDTTTKQGPQIAAAHDGSGDSWIIFPRRDPTTANYDYGSLWSWSQDWGATWSGPGWVNSMIDYHEVLPSITIYDASGSYYPYVSTIRSYYDWTNPLVQTYNWQSDSFWSPDTSFNDSVPAFTRPAQTWEFEGYPAIAYVGASGVNVYYDSWSMSYGVDERNAQIAPAKLQMQNRPNPFRTNTLLEYNVPVSGKVSLKIYNTLGQEVAKLVDEYKLAGTYTFNWKGLDKQNLTLPKGVYFAKLQVGKLNATRKIIVH